jgi:prepilin-type N-terminal cleavage/methylation domain-containing protein
MTRRSRRARRGMTIIEVMIAIGVLLIMASVGWASVQGAVEMNDALAQGDMAARSARVTLSRLRRELALAYLTPNRTTANSYITLFVGEDADPDRLWFQTLGHQRLYRNSAECDQAEVTVWGERAPSGQGEGYILYHRESARIDQYPDEGGRIYPLAYNVRTFNVRYLDGRVFEWLDEWDTRSPDQPYILPRAVELGLVLIAPDPEDPERSTIDVPYLTTVIVEYADPVQPLLGPGLNPMAVQ